MTYDKYIKFKLKPKFIDCPFYENAKTDLDKLLGGIPHEKDAYKLASDKANSKNPDKSPSKQNHVNATLPFLASGTYSIGSISATGMRGPKPTSYEDLPIEKRDFYVLVERYGPIHPAPLEILVDHLLRSLGCIIWGLDKWEENALNALLCWYAKHYAGQEECTEMLYIRECADYAQAFINTQNRIMEIFIKLARKHSYNFNKVPIVVRPNLVCFSKGCSSSDIPVMEKHVQFIHENIRKPWVHSQWEIILKEVLSFEMFDHIRESFRSILLQYEGLFLWYCKPENHVFAAHPSSKSD